MTRVENLCDNHPQNAPDVKGGILQPGDCVALLADLLRCPSCGQTLNRDREGLRCRSGHRRFPTLENLVVLIDAEGLRSFLDTPLGKDLHAQADGGYLTCEAAISALAGLVEDTARPTSDQPGGGDTPTYPDDPALAKAVALAERKMAELADVSHRSPLLDMATGPGRFVESIASLLPSSSLLVCTEIRLQTIASTRRRLSSRLRNPTLYVACDISTVPFRDGAFSAIAGCGALSEIADMARILRKCYRALRPGGILALTGDQYRDPSPSLQIAESLGVGSLATPQRLRASLQRAGFTVLEYVTTYEGLDTDTLPDEERCPLPARGDWSAHCVVAARKPT